MNFRSIRTLSWFPMPGINCLVGPGDSGKSTILDAIDLCMGARRTIQFTDADFNDLAVDAPIEITITLGALSERLKTLDAYGLFLRGFDAASGEIEDEPQAGLETVLCLRLTVGADLEPVWTLVSDRAAALGSERYLAWSDRQDIAPTRIGSFSDGNLSWRRGSVLNKLSQEKADASAILLAAARDARVKFGDTANEHPLQPGAGFLGCGQTSFHLDARGLRRGQLPLEIRNEGGTVPARRHGARLSRSALQGLTESAARVTLSRLSGQSRPLPALGPDHPPVDPLEQGGELRRRQPDHPVRRLRPMEAAAFQLLVDQDEARLVPDEAFQLVAALRPEQVDRAAVGIVAEDALHDQREAGMTFPEVDRPRREIGAGYPARQDHAAPRIAAITRPR
jgi:hypothetical protein